jgi:hypothetical protein
MLEIYSLIFLEWPNFYCQDLASRNIKVPWSGTSGLAVPKEGGRGGQGGIPLVSKELQDGRLRIVKC